MNKLIRLVDGVARVVDDDPWQLVRQGEDMPDNARLILPLAQWLTRRDHAHGLWLTPDDEVESLREYLPVLPLIAIDFPNFRDGRGYSQAYLLRSRMGWRGELRAVGDVLRDQLSHMRQCGFDAFALRADKSVEDALQGLAGISVLYARSAIEPRPLFRRRGNGMA